MTDLPVVESITPSPLGRTLLVALAGVAVGVALGYAIAKILEEERFGHYREAVGHDDPPGTYPVENLLKVDGDNTTATEPEEQ